MIKDDCLFKYDVECPYAAGYWKCDDCDKYQKDTRKHPLDDSDRGCAEYHFGKDMREVR
jgi:hypothetical protein